VTSDNRYAQIRSLSRVRERELFLQPRSFTEMELQARWFAGDFGKEFVSTAGDKIDIIQFGIWNREPGPDFRDAAIRINGREAVRGCVELDLVDRNWEIHGHATNPAFEDTVIHVFVDQSSREFFTRTKSNRNVPQVRIDPATLPDAFFTNSALAKPGRCQGPLRNLTDERVQSVLDSAAQFRLRQKTTRLRRKIESDGCDDTLFREIAAALGYKENRLPFTLVAQRLPLKTLRENLDHAEAMLFGVAGFLEAADLTTYKKSSRRYVRTLWDCWWPHRDGLQRLVLPKSAWKIVSTRPVNHPQRRLAALSVLVREWPAFRRSLGFARASDSTIVAAAVSGGRGLRQNARMRAEKFFAGLDHPFWKRNYTLTAKPSLKSMAVIGDSRIAEILANVVFPFWWAEAGDKAARTDLWAEYTKLPARLTNRRIEIGATRLFGNDPRRKKFLQTVAHQQGLLQIYEDFCLHDNSDCTHCPFPEQMQNWK
jgi:hypothetical protein